MNKRLLVLDDDHQLLKVYEGILLPDPGAAEAAKLAAFLGEVVEEPEDLEGVVNFEVTLLDQGIKGVEAVKSALQDGKPYAAAFLDNRMPPGIDGLEAAQRIRELDPHVIIHMITAYADHPVDQIHEKLKHDVQMLRKPITRDEIFQLARDACERWQHEHDLRVRLEEVEAELVALSREREELLATQQGGPERTVVVDFGGGEDFEGSWVDMLDK
uniref:Putative CheY-like Response regulator n=1 Tax=Magnetococcus massalia (strain MO-1) TaxID=451514 RepID=A0A1S7LHT6_MAGMO|nr:putative CheY-like Response regulator [Candidatus Magnetococcus massalia]